MLLGLANRFREILDVLLKGQLVYFLKVSGHENLSLFGADYSGNYNHLWASSGFLIDFNRI